MQKRSSGFAGGLRPLQRWKDTENLEHDGVHSPLRPPPSFDERESGMVQI